MEKCREGQKEIADDAVICSESKKPAEPGSRLYALERRGMKVNRRKTHMVTVQIKCNSKRWRKWRISNTWAQLFKVMESAEEK